MENKQTPARQGSIASTGLTMPLTSYLETVQPKGILDVLNSKAGQISKIIHERGDAEIKAMLSKQIISLNKFFNFSRIMEQDQVMETVSLIIESFPIYMPEDFVLCFKNIKLLKYGKFFEGIDGAKILEMIRAYDLERDEQIMEVRRKEANQFKADNRLMAEPVAEVSKKILAVTKAKEPPKLREKTGPEILMDGFMKEFAIMHDQQSHPYSTIKFVEYKGKMMDLSSFCNIRFEEETN